MPHCSRQTAPTFRIKKGPHVAKRLLHTCDIRASTLTGPFGTDVVDVEDFHITASMIRSGFDPDSIWVKARALGSTSGIVQPLLRHCPESTDGKLGGNGTTGEMCRSGRRTSRPCQDEGRGSNAVRRDFPDHPKGRSTQKLMRMDLGLRPLLAQYRCPPEAVSFRRSGSG